MRSMQRHVEVDEPGEDEFTIDASDLELQFSAGAAAESDDDSDDDSDADAGDETAEGDE